MLKICRVSALVLLGAAVMAAAPAVQAKGYGVIHDFTGDPGDGERPMSDVTFDTAGNLYGTTYDGGASDNGTIYKIATDGTETLLHSFNGTSGANPAAGVTIDPATGDLYGVTHTGGTNGTGTLYKLSAGGTFTVLHNFTGGSNDGRYPQWRMLRDKRGNLYGVTQSGGPLDEGTVFKYAANGTFTILHTFDTSSGPPLGRLARDHDGNLYVVTNAGGTSHACSGHGCGGIYRLSPDGTFTLLYSFTNDTDGRYPAAGVTIDTSDNLYGTTQFGGAGSHGTVFRLMPEGTFDTLYSFDGTNGSDPACEVLKLKDNLYVTSLGGGANGSGTIVKIPLVGTATVLHDFTGADGSLPSAGLVKGGRLLYGTASGGGSQGRGVVFSINK